MIIFEDSRFQVEFHIRNCRKLNRLQIHFQKKHPFVKEVLRSLVLSASQAEKTFIEKSRIYQLTLKAERLVVGLSVKKDFLSTELNLPPPTGIPLARKNASPFGM